MTDTLNVEGQRYTLRFHSNGLSVYEAPDNPGAFAVQPAAGLNEVVVAIAGHFGIEQPYGKGLFTHCVVRETHSGSAVLAGLKNDLWLSPDTSVVERMGGRITSFCSVTYPVTDTITYDITD
jgi:hypothetical protein